MTQQKRSCWGNEEIWTLHLGGAGGAWKTEVVCLQGGARAVASKVLIVKSRGEAPAKSGGTRGSLLSQLGCFPENRDPS